MYKKTVEKECRILLNMVSEKLEIDMSSPLITLIISWFLLIILLKYTYSIKRGIDYGI